MTGRTTSETVPAMLVRDLLRRLHREPMQHAAGAAMLLAAWERAVADGDLDVAVSAARLLKAEVRAIAVTLQAVEVDGLVLLERAAHESMPSESTGSSET